MEETASETTTAGGDPSNRFSSSSHIRVEGSAVGAALVTGCGNVVTIVYGAEFLRERRPDAAPRPTTEPRELGPNPYRGLDVFDETSSELFFGREDDTERLLDRLATLVAPAAAGRTRLLAVVGPSGSGKSSVARAGLVPGLARTTTIWLRGAEVAVLRPGASPVDALAVVLARLVTRDPAPLAKQGEIAEDIRARAQRRQFDGVGSPGTELEFAL